MKLSAEVEKMVSDIEVDLASGAAELALRAINVFRTTLAECQTDSLVDARERLTDTARAIVKAHPAMASMYNLGTAVLNAAGEVDSIDQLNEKCSEALTLFEKRLCESASKIADLVYDLVPAGENVFAYSFSSTVVSSLLSARSQKKFFRAVCTEARPSMEGRRLATMLASGGLEVIHSFDLALGLILPTCRVAFMGVDCVGRPGLVNKVGSWVLALACRELNIPLYALAGTEKFVPDDVFFAFEDHTRPGAEAWDKAPQGVKVLNHQFELVPFNWIAGLVTDEGILREAQIDEYVNRVQVHPRLEELALA
jgi:translation initiation factor eIF-2B subunit delta